MIYLFYFIFATCRTSDLHPHPHPPPNTASLLVLTHIVNIDPPLLKCKVGPAADHIWLAAHQRNGEEARAISLRAAV